MSHLSFRNSHRCRRDYPRPVQDPTMRRRAHGPVQPMEQPTLLERLSARLRRRR